jgi:glycerate-2-kinase
MPPDREFLLDLYRTAVSAVEPARALSAALDRDAAPAGAGRTWIISLGKAAYPLAAGAVAWLDDHGQEPAGGVIVSTEQAPPPHSSLTTVVGDHPLPGPRSLHAAEVLEETVRVIPPSDDVWVLLSGGTTSLLASPVRGITDADLRVTYETMLRSGLDIHDMNRVRKRISRWGGGRLAVALAHVDVRVFILSDVVGDDTTIVGSGPCSPDRTTAQKLRARLAAAGMLQRLPAAVTDIIDRTERGMLPETPKPGAPAFRTVTEHVIGSNATAVAAAAAAAEAAGLIVRHKRTPLSGDAAHLGHLIGRRMVGEIERGSEPTCFVAGGETTVTLDESTGRGGRCQELALAAARVLDGATGARITLLAAGTDGRDGPTDAAGAIVDQDTWRAIREAGRDPVRDLENHDSGTALESVDALIRTGPTGTNVNDVLFVIVRPAD